MRYSSEDAAQVVEYIEAVIDFIRKNKPHKQAIKLLKDLKNEVELREHRQLERKLTQESEKEDEVYLYIYRISQKNCAPFAWLFWRNCNLKCSLLQRKSVNATLCLRSCSNQSESDCGFMSQESQNMCLFETQHFFRRPAMPGSKKF